eukprot:scaffold520018_cov17-Prasinocladus_malaysianus.AAC.1
MGDGRRRKALSVAPRTRTSTVCVQTTYVTIHATVSDVRYRTSTVAPRGRVELRPAMSDIHANFKGISSYPHIPRGPRVGWTYDLDHDDCSSST